MGKTVSARELLEQLEFAEMKQYPDDVREEAQKLLLSRHLALLEAMRKAADRQRGKPRA